MLEFDCLANKKIPTSVPGGKSYVYFYNYKDTPNSIP